VTPRDVRRLIDGLALLVDSGARRRSMGEAGRRKALVEFDQQTVIDITLATYERVRATSRR
jgi:hypothetical protein